MRLGRISAPNRADVRLTLLVTVLTGLSIATTPGTTVNQGPALVALAAGTVGTALFLWTTASAVALSLAAGTLVSNAAKLWWRVVRNDRRPRLDNPGPAGLTDAAESRNVRRISARMNKS
jgi:hypothetical protein